METNNKASFKEAIEKNFRAFKLAFSRSPKMLVVTIISIFWEALTPYVGVYLSAKIINELSEAKSKDVIIKLVVASLLCAAVISLVKALIDKVSAVEQEKAYNFDLLYSDKMMEMDFADVDKTETMALLSTIKQSENSQGWGISRSVSAAADMLKALLTMAGGAALTVSLFALPVPSEAKGYAVLNNPLFVVLIIAVMASIAYLAPALQNKGESFIVILFKEHNLGNRLFSYFGFMGGKKEYAQDMRTYNQVKVCEANNLGKEGLFGSRGLYAKLSRGVVGAYAAASSAVSVVFTGIVYVFVCLKALGGAFGIGSVTQYISAITMVSGGASSIIASLGELKNNVRFLDMVFEFFDMPHSMYKGSLTVEKRLDREYEIEFKDVSFKYPGSETYALHHASMKFKIGERLAVVGQNGSGKTTFIKLLCRLYDPTEGEILLNGINIQKYDYREYLNIFSVVFQDFKLLSFKLGENVAASSDVDKDLAAECLTKAGFGERLKHMPKGLDTYLYKDITEQGVNISGGEAQKIALARALYKNSPFIILDEPTAALDPIAEAEVYSSFNEIIDDKTAIYISHRLSSCRFCDEIAVFDSGKIVQKGTHDDLLADESGKYFELWNAQAQYYC